MFIHHYSVVLIKALEQLVVSGGYYIVFLISTIESFPLLGSVIPGHTIVVLSGFMAKLGYLNPLYLFLVVTVGATIGDILAYSAGKKYGYNLLSKYGPYFLLKNSHIEKAKEVVSTHTGKALILGRFTPVTRALMPFVVGASHVHIRKFWAYDVLGCMLWAGSSIALGYVFGASYEIAAQAVGKIMIVAVIGSLLLIWGYRYVNVRRDIFHKHELIVLVLNIIGIYVFAKMLQDSASATSYLTQFDVWINLFFEKFNHTYAGFFIYVSDIFSPSKLGVVTLLFGVYTIYKKRYRQTIVVLGATAGGLLSVALFKELIERARPDNALFIQSGYSFPSGHALSATIFFFCVAYLFSRKIKRNVYREIFIVFCVFMVAVVGFSRMYLNVHWFTDVVAGYALGLFIVSGVVLFVRYVVASHFLRLMNMHERK